MTDFLTRLRAVACRARARYADRRAAAAEAHRIAQLGPVRIPRQRTPEEQS